MHEFGNFFFCDLIILTQKSTLLPFKVSSEKWTKTKVIRRKKKVKTTSMGVLYCFLVSLKLRKINEIC